jgi:non-reducing end alpha-L-arabinofuranosidase
MRKRSLSNELLLVAILSMGSLACQTTTGIKDSTGGASGSAGGASGSGGSSVAGGAGGDAAGGAAGSGGTTSAKTFDPKKLPCDTYKEDDGPCVAAHSTVRLLLSSYSGALYQVRRTSDGATKDIGVKDGFANAADQDAFCGEESCTISIIYDQSEQHNDLTKAPPGGAKKTGDKEADAKSLPITLSGHNVYGEHNPPGVGYRNNAAQGTATGDNAQTVYMIVDGGYSNAGCCFDYGNAERNSMDNGEGTMEAVYFGSCTIWNKGDGDGPWIMGDLENGLWAGDSSPYAGNKTVKFDSGTGKYKYITGMVKGNAAGKNNWVIKIGDAQSGPLAKPFDGPRPSARYNPMRKEGAIILGTGGDNSNAAQGNFFEGVMTAHFSSDAADDAVQANIVSVYGQ